MTAHAELAKGLFIILVLTKRDGRAAQRKPWPVAQAKDQGTPLLTEFHNPQSNSTIAVPVSLLIPVSVPLAALHGSQQCDCVADFVKDRTQHIAVEMIAVHINTPFQENT